MMGDPALMRGMAEFLPKQPDLSSAYARPSLTPSLLPIGAGANSGLQLLAAAQQQGATGGAATSMGGSSGKRKAANPQKRPRVSCVEAPFFLLISLASCGDAFAREACFVYLGNDNKA